MNTIAVGCDGSSDDGDSCSDIDSDDIYDGERGVVVDRISNDVVGMRKPRCKHDTSDDADEDFRRYEKNTTTVRHTPQQQQHEQQKQQKSQRRHEHQQQRQQFQPAADKHHRAPSAGQIVAKMASHKTASYDGIYESTKVKMTKSLTQRDRHLLIDSRDRDIATYSSARQFDMFLGERLRGLKSIELINIVIPVVAGFTERYVVLTESHCDDSMMFADRVPFGNSTMTPATPYTTGCAFPRGSLAMIQMVPNAFAGAAVQWQSNNVDKSWKCRFLVDLANTDRLSFSVWMRAGTNTVQLYNLPDELPPPVVPALANNYVMVLRLKYKQK